MQRTRNATIHLPKATLADLDALAAKERRSRSNAAALLIAEALTAREFGSSNPARQAG
jgi:hypothetical protein